ncbi:unnamed protein product [Acanthoscelides obtectus]|uniref:DUF7869 domain-containing protein n=1 Tax=Acanthoscelides obtectus TaxID=200917 RepID=A0A9P0LF75_ACAOB|nr:unnamed protein product [Acanthoscelides obtectus]CAK1681283.1 hypothetical protein AOBTE_LOCUS33088 [Acanthoscelides obtectus]
MTSVVTGTSTDKLRPKNVFSYLWTEIDARKDSNTIASALQHALKNFDPSKETVRLFADGCGGQNKNANMMAMLAYWLLEESPKHIKQIELIFPIVGHSFIPPDRIFGLIGKDIKKMPVIVEISDYDDLIRKHSTIWKIGIDWDVFDWRTQAKQVIKLPSSWHFEFNKAKRFIFYRKDKNVLVKEYIEVRLLTIIKYYFLVELINFLAKLTSAEPESTDSAKNTEEKENHKTYIDECE